MPNCIPMQERTPSSHPFASADEPHTEACAVASPTPSGLAPGVLSGGSGWEWNSPAAAELEARRMFHRTLSAWAMDVLALRKRGLDTPRCLTRSMGLVTPRAAA